MDEKISGYFVKYALSKGIYEVRDAELKGKYVVGNAPFHFFVKFGKDFVRTREEAERVAGAMALAKIASLRQQIAKLEKLATKPHWAKGE